MKKKNTDKHCFVRFIHFHNFFHFDIFSFRRFFRIRYLRSPAAPERRHQRTDLPTSKIFVFFVYQRHHFRVHFAGPVPHKMQTIG